MQRAGVASDVAVGPVHPWQHAGRTGRMPYNVAARESRTKADRNTQTNWNLMPRCSTDVFVEILR